MIIMRGLPASGKSTRAKELQETMGNAVRINKDLLRKMLHFDRFTGRNEGLTRNASRTLAMHFLTNGTNVIIDDTNLNPGTLQSWKDLAKYLDEKVEVLNLDTPVEECVSRDEGRTDSVGADVIRQMAMQFGLYPVPEKGFVVCDIDGTIADIEHRKSFIAGPTKDWKGFFNAMRGDTIRPTTAQMLVDWKLKGNPLIFVSARPDTYREETTNWLRKHLANQYGVFWVTLIMRKEGDKRPDTEVKQDIFDRYLKNLPIAMVIDDRPSVIRMWKANGLEVTDVGAGVEF